MSRFPERGITSPKTTITTGQRESSTRLQVGPSVMQRVLHAARLASPVLCRVYEFDPVQ